MESVIFKGTRYGIIISLKDSLDFPEVFSILEEKLKERPDFFHGSSVSLELGWRNILASELDQLIKLIQQYHLELMGVISASLVTQKLAKDLGLKVIIGRLGLSDHKGRKTAIAAATNQIKEDQIPEAISANEPIPVPIPGDQAFLLKRTIRSGQQLFFPGNVVILGDVNPGGTVEATGDIVVMGNLRGNALAGCEGNQEAMITALEFSFSQLKIAGQQAEEQDKRKVSRGGAYQARLENRKIVFHLYK